MLAKPSGIKRFVTAAGRFVTNGMNLSTGRGKLTLRAERLVLTVACPPFARKVR
jgi:hypothetical protein